MGYLYSALWFIVAAVLLIRFRKESAVVYILSGYFAFAGVWWLADQLAEADMLSGIYGWILRIVSAVMLIGVGIVYVIEKNLKENGYIITDNMGFHGYVEMNEEEIESKNIRGIVRKIKDYIYFLENNMQYKTVIYKIGDGIAVTERR